MFLGLNFFNIYLIRKGNILGKTNDIYFWFRQFLSFRNNNKVSIIFKLNSLDMKWEK